MSHPGGEAAAPKRTPEKQSSKRRHSISMYLSPLVHCSKLVIKDGLFKAECSKKLDDLKLRHELERAIPSISGSEDKIQSTMKDEITMKSSAVSTQPAVSERPGTPAEEQQMLVPDSTTSQLEGKQTFSSGDDVFVKQRDGRYYLGTVMRSSPGGERWLVRFGDETERWASGAELRPLAATAPGEGAVLCVVCKLRGGSAEVLACDQCGRGYHRACHSPQPPNCYMQGVSWQCHRCVEQRYKVAALENRAIRKEMLKMKQIVRPPDKLPYDLNSLHWDTQHRTNTERVYCYCGGPGDWFGQMLQCARCRQWFHQLCLSCLKYPLYTGDRFYVFVCSLCNYGTEFVRRLELKWVDLVHLMLFNLTAYNCKKYYDLDSVIIPYIMDNLYALQLPVKMQAVTPAERREEILSALTNNRNRFKCGREIKKRAAIWGLRARTPPLPPSPVPGALPTRGPVTEQALTARWPAFIPETDSPSSSQDSGQQQRMIVPVDSHWLSVMMGKRFQSSSNSSDNESLRSTPSPVDFKPAALQNLHGSAAYGFSSKHSDLFGSKTEREDSPYSFKEDVKLEKPISPPVKRKELKFYEMDFQGGGFVKKSVPFPELSLNKRKKLLNSLKQRCKKKDRKDSGPVDLQKDETFNRTTKMLRNRFTKHQERIQQKLRTHSTRGTNTPPVEDESVFTLLDNRNVSKESNNSYEVTMKSHEVILPPTPPTSVSAPPTPPAAVLPSSGSSSSDVPPDFQVSQSDKSKTCSYDSDRDAGDFAKDDRVVEPTVCREMAKVVQEKTPIKINKEIKEKSSFSGAFTNGHNSKIAAINLEISKLSTKNIIEHSKIMSLHHMNDPYSLFQNEQDSSGDDTSSRGTLDSIIPPPANFQGKNNPFHLQADSSRGKSSKGGFSVANKLFNRHSLSKMANSSGSAMKNQRISLPASLNPVIGPPVKPLKRQLSEKDLVIGPNGEVKRRRHRRPRKAVQTLTSTPKEGPVSERQKSLRSSTGLEDSSKQPPPSVVDSQQVNTCMDYAQNVRCLRQRQEKNYSDGRRGSTSSNANNVSTGGANNNSSLNVSTSSNNALGTNSSGVRTLNLSPQKMSPFKNGQSTTGSSTDSIQDLKTSVHSYFGAANRIGAGEKFTLIGKRQTDNGNLQYLIEWEGHGS